MDRGNCSLTADEFMSLMMGKGPINLGASFLEVPCKVMSPVESHTFCPIAYVGD